MNFPEIYHCAKIGKNKWAIPTKNAELMDAQTSNGDFIKPTIGRGSYKLRYLLRSLVLPSPNI